MSIGLLLSPLRSTALRPGSPTAATSAPRTSPPALPADQPRQPLERLHHQRRAGRGLQHRSHDLEMPAPMGWSRFQNRRPSPSKDRHVRRTLHWPPERRAPKKRFKESLKRSLTTCNIDHEQWSDLAACRPCGLAPQNPPGCCPVRSGRKKLTRRQDTEEEDPRRLHHHTRHCFSLQTALEAQSLPQSS